MTPSRKAQAGRGKITDKQRLDLVLRFLNENPVISNEGKRVFHRSTIDAAIRRARKGR